LLDSNFIGLIKLKAKRRLLKGEKLYKLCLASKMKELFNKKTNKREGKQVRRLHANLSGYHLAPVCGFRYFLGSFVRCKSNCIS
jgi:hypothetical protein